MQYFFDFDRTVFNTDLFKKDFAGRPPLRELFHQAKELLKETFDRSRTVSFRHIVTRTLGTYASHRRFGFVPQELKEYLYPDAVEFFNKHGEECVIVTYGVQAFITAKVANALTDFPLGDIVYTSRKKGRTIKRLIENKAGPFVFVDDAHFQLKSVKKICPDVDVIEIRRDGNEGDGQWPIIKSMNELESQCAHKDELAIDLKTASVAVLLNTASGSYTKDAEPNIKELLAAAGVLAPIISPASPKDVEPALKRIMDSKPDILIVLGGDGTIRTAAEACTIEGPLLIPLPGGTMNMLPKALYGDRSWQDVLRDTLASPKTKSISGGIVQGREFFIAAIVGTPSLWANAREALREGDVGAAFEKGVHAFQNMLATRIEYAFSAEQRGTADAVTVICPLISTDMADSEQALEAAVIDVQNAGGILNLASAAAFGQWRESAHVTTTKTKTVTISAEQDIPLILDGETMELGNYIEITFLPGAFKVLLPAS